MVAASLHVAAMKQVGAATGNDVAAAHVHGNAHHAVRGHATTGRGDHRGDVCSTGLRVKVGPPTALPIQLTLGVIGVGCSTGGESAVISMQVTFTNTENKFR